MLVPIKHRGLLEEINPGLRRSQSEETDMLTEDLRAACQLVSPCRQKEGSESLRGKARARESKTMHGNIREEGIEVSVCQEGAPVLHTAF